MASWADSSLHIWTANENYNPALTSRHCLGHIWATCRHIHLNMPIATSSCPQYLAATPTELFESCCSLLWFYYSSAPPFSSSPRKTIHVLTIPYGLPLVWKLHLSFELLHTWATLVSDYLQSPHFNLHYVLSSRIWIGLDPSFSAGLFWASDVTRRLSVVQGSPDIPLPRRRVYSLEGHTDQEYYDEARSQFKYNRLSSSNPGLPQLVPVHLTHTWPDTITSAPLLSCPTQAPLKRHQLIISRHLG